MHVRIKIFKVLVRIAVASILGLSSSFSYAQAPAPKLPPKSPAAPQKTKPMIKKRPAPTGYVNSGATPAAAPKTLGMAAVVGYLYIGGGGGASLWKIAAPGRHYGGNFLYGSGEVTAEGDAAFLEYMQLNTGEASGFARFFWGESFNVNLSLGLNTYKGAYGFKVNEDFENGGQKVTSRFTGYGIVAGLAVGNQWQLPSGLVIGCDWIGVNALLYKDIKGSESDAGLVSSGETDEARRKQFEQDVEKLLNKVVLLRLLMVHVGYVF